MRRHIVSLAVSAFALTFTAPAYCGLIHHYVFNGDATDQAGAVNGVLNGDAVASGGVLTLDGSGDSVTFGSNYLVPTTGNYSVALKAQYVYTGAAMEFMSQGGGGAAFYIGPYGNEIRITDNYYWTGTPPFSGSCGGCGGVEAPQDGLWHSYALVVTGSNAEFFIDGVSRATRSGFALYSPGIPTALGVQYNGGEFFAGSLADVRVYDNALSSSDVLAIANGANAPEPGSALLVVAGAAALLLKRRRAA